MVSVDAVVVIQDDVITATELDEVIGKESDDEFIEVSGKDREDEFDVVTGWETDEANWLKFMFQIEFGELDWITLLEILETDSSDR